MAGPALDLIRFTTEPSCCAYLSHETAQMEYRVPFNLEADVFNGLLQRGWRRFGNYVFRPRCPACTKCISLRVSVPGFSPTKSQRRCLRRNSGIEITVVQPDTTNEHVDLFNAYHADMTRRRGWHENSTSLQDYYESFIGGDFEFAQEFQYREHGRLVGVGLVDAPGEVLSSVYFYHDPAWRRRGPGTFSILSEINYARETGRQWHYLGYWISENESMDYKARFRPHQLLQSWVDDDDEPVWIDCNVGDS